VGTLLLAVGAIGVFYVLLPNVAGLDDAWSRINEGDPWWLGLAFTLERSSIRGLYIALFRAVFARDQERIDNSAMGSVATSVAHHIDRAVLITRKRSEPA
jgi:hypothetical protein